MAETKNDANAAFDAFIETYAIKYDKAVGCLTKDREALLAFYYFPAEHWKHLLTTNPIESTFATVRHRTVRSKGCLSNRTAIAMVFKLAQAAEKSWRRLDGHSQLPKLITGVKFIDGIEAVSQPPLAAYPDRHQHSAIAPDFAQAQHLAQRMAGGGRIQHPRGRQFGRRLRAGGQQSGPAPDRGGVAARGAAAQCRAQCGAQCRARRARGRAATRGRFPPLRRRAAVWRRATRRAVAQCARRASATGWRGSGFWSCRLRGNFPAAGWPAASLGLGQRPHTCTDRITIARDVNLNQRVYMTSQTSNVGLFPWLNSKNGQSSV